MNPKYSVVIPWCNRDDLEQSLRRNDAKLSSYPAEVIIVNAGGDPARLGELVARSGVRNTRSVTLPDAPFNLSLCRNIGTLASRGAIVFLLDADIVLDSDILVSANEVFRHRGRYVAIERILESRPEVNDRPEMPDMSFLAHMRVTEELATTDGRRAVLSRLTSPGATRIGDALVLVRRQDLLDVGGLNSGLTGWGYEDTDLQLRLQFLLGLKRVALGTVTHLSHAATGRDVKSYQQNLRECTRNYSRGAYRGTLEQDGQQWRDALTEASPAVDGVVEGRTHHRGVVHP